MGAIPAARKTLQAVVRNPILFAAAIAIAIGSGAVSASSQIPLIGVFISFVLGIGFFFLEPFLAGGLLGMGREALSGEPTVDTFTENGKRVYLRLLAARFIEWIIGLIFFGGFLLVGIILFIIFVGAGSVISGTPDAAVGALGILGILLFIGGFVVVTLIYYVIGFFIQFHPAAIVVEDASLIESLKRSVNVVKSDPLGALGYSILVTLISGTIGAIPALYVSLAGGAVEVIAQEDPQALLGLGVMNATIFFGLFVVIQTLLLPFLLTYHVAFYLDATEDNPDNMN
jgi:hypothetical protein